MRGPPGAGTAVATFVLLALTACHPAPSGFTLLFLGRSPAARVGSLSWAPDPDHSRLVAFDGTLHVVRTIADPRLATPMAVAALHGRLLVTERTGEGVVFDTAGTLVREWPSPFPASLYATGGGTDRIVAARSPYLVQFVGEDGSQPLLWLLDTLGHPSHGLGVIHVPEGAYLAQLANAGAVAVGQDGSIYFAPLVRDEILKLDPTGATVWRTQRGLFRQEPDPHFLPPKGREIRVAHALVNIALADIFMYSVRSHKSPRGCAVPLCVEKCRVVIGAGQQGSPALHPVFFGQAVLGQRRAIFRTVFPRARQCILQGQSQRSVARGLIGDGFRSKRVCSVLGGCHRNQTQHREHQHESFAERASRIIWHTFHPVRRQPNKHTGGR